MAKKSIKDKIRRIKKFIILPNYLRRMKKLSIGGFSYGNNVRLITDGDDCFSSFLFDILSARKSINLETFIFRSDEVGWKIAKALVSQSKKGIEVNVIYDAIGSLGTSQKIFSFMQNGGIEVLEYHPIAPWRKYFNITFRDHRKILVIDGKIGYVGGINIGKEYAGKRFKGEGWRDTHLRIEGPAVKEIQFFFIENWYRQGGSVINPNLHFPVVSAKGNTMLMVISTRSRKKIRPVFESYYYAIITAKKSIYITNAYFVPDRKIRHAIIHAAKRGVEVKLLLPGKSDVPIVKYACRYLYNYYIRHNVRIFEYQKSILHAKTAVIDDVLTTVGSSNLDRQSLYTNLELNVMVLDDHFGRKMNKVFDTDMKSSREISGESLKRRKPSEFLIEWLSYRFRNIL